MFESVVGAIIFFGIVFLVVLGREKIRKNANEAKAQRLRDVNNNRDA
ncbi:MAG: hypothetical protein JWR36_1697 [Glaciihabitans sp.]|jgi:hypothetical protein|nr:hypothetical protein [Glaciihabitans sp.]